MLFIGSQMVVIALGLLPFKLWRSFRAGADLPPAGHARSGDEKGGTPAPAGA